MLGDGRQVSLYINLQSSQTQISLEGAAELPMNIISQADIWHGLGEDILKLVIGMSDGAGAAELQIFRGG